MGEAVALKAEDVDLEVEIPKIKIAGETPGNRKSPGDVALFNLWFSVRKGSLNEALPRRVLTQFLTGEWLWCAGPGSPGILDRAPPAYLPGSPSLGVCLAGWPGCVSGWRSPVRKLCERSSLCKGSAVTKLCKGAL